MVRSSAQAPDEESINNPNPNDTSDHVGRVVDEADIDAGTCPLLALSWGNSRYHQHSKISSTYFFFLEGDLSRLQKQKINELLGAW